MSIPSSQNNLKVFFLSRSTKFEILKFEIGCNKVHGEKGQHYLQVFPAGVQSRKINLQSTKTCILGLNYIKVSFQNSSYVPSF